MGNPYCPNCDKHPLLKSVKRLVWDKHLPLRRGMSKFWECPKCKRRWKKGAVIIRKK